MKNIGYTVYNSYVRLFGKIFRKLKKFFVYQTKYGLKYFGILTPLPKESYENNEVIRISPQTLYLGLDGLKNEFTFIGKPITESPHFDLIRSYYEGNINSSVYIKLEKNGRLDSRDVLNSSEAFHKNACRNAEKNLKEDDYKPIIFYQIEGKRYLYDGKHRAALAAYLGKDIRAVEISPEYLYNRYISKMCGLVRSKPEEYNKHEFLVRAVEDAHKAKFDRRKT